MITAGVLRPGEKLPDVGELARELSINPHAVAAAYAELDGRGVLYTLPGRGSFVSENAPLLLDEMRQDRLRTLTELSRCLAREGIPEEDAVDCLRRAYREG
jgi:transcriptional regulator, GntR family